MVESNNNTATTMRAVAHGVRDSSGPVLSHKRMLGAQSTLRRVANHLGNDRVETWTDADLCAAFRRATNHQGRHQVYAQRCLLKHILGEATDGTAPQRFPMFWTDGRLARRLTGRNISVANVIPAPMYRGGCDPALVQLFERTVRHLQLRSGMRRPSTLRNALNFLYRFCFVDRNGLRIQPTDKTSEDDPRTRWLTPLRNQTRESLVEAYRRYRRDRPRVHLAVLSRHVFLLSMFFHHVLHVFSHPLTPALFGLPDTRSGECGLPMGIEDEEAAGWVRPTREGWPGGNEERVHTFNADEVRRLYLACETLFERILFTTLFTTGMRILRDDAQTKGKCAFSRAPTPFAALTAHRTIESGRNYSASRRGTCAHRTACPPSWLACFMNG